MTTLFDLTGKVAVITGGSRGLGYEIANAYADAGAEVVLASRKVDACERAADEIANRTGRRAVGLAYHAGQWSDSDRLVDAVYQRFGRCDVVVNNAGMSPVYPSLGGVSEDLFDKVLGVNFKGPFRLSVLFGERMMADGSGSIINVSSIAAVQPTPGDLVYAGAKAALNNMTLGLARAFAPTVRCNVIMPGPFMTDVTKAWDLEAFDRQAQRHIPLRRGGQPSEIVGAALYLATEASSYTTGAVIKVDGGAAYAPA